MMIAMFIFSYVVIGIVVASIILYPQAKRYKKTTVDGIFDNLNGIETAGMIALVIFLLVGWPIYIIAELVIAVVSRIINFIFKICKWLD